MVKLSNPLVVKFTANGSRKAAQTAPDMLEIDANADWKQFKDLVAQGLKSEQFDYVMTTFDESAQNASKNAVKSLDIKLNALIKDTSNADLNIYNRFGDKTYWLNAGYKDGKYYAEPDETVVAKYDSFDDKYAWQHHQAELFQKFAAMMPVSDGKFNSADHVSLLTDPGRGLEQAELDQMFSWKSNKVITPGLMGDDMIGMPGVSAKYFDGVELYYKDKAIEGPMFGLKTGGFQGYVIPMKNVNGEFAKFQVGVDISPSNVYLKAKSADGVTIQKSEYWDANDPEYKFKGGRYKFTINGKPSELHVKRANNDEQVFEDINGEFTTKAKQDIKDVLIERGYDIPEVIDKLNVVPSAKYMWPIAGSMTGTKKPTFKRTPDSEPISPQDTVIPSNAGFIKAREPQNGSDEYVVLVAEGALKGMITAKYIDRPDSTGVSFADKIAGDKGIIVAQIPGVVDKLIHTIEHVYDDTDLNIKGTYIAMDADGRDNIKVCEGIHSAYNILGKKSPVKVLSWDPAQKGIDDALLAVAHNEITVADMGIHFGKPEQLFPMENAKAPIPMRLDGTLAYAKQPEWQTEHTAKVVERDNTLTSAQEEARALAQTGKSSDVHTVDNNEVHDVETVETLETPVSDTESLLNSEPAPESESHELSDIDFKDFASEMIDLNKAYQDHVRAVAEKYGVKM